MFDPEVTLSGSSVPFKCTINHPIQSLTVNFHCEFSSRFHSDSKRIRSGFESKRRESPRIHNVLAQQYGFANFGPVFTVICCETVSWALRCDYGLSTTKQNFCGSKS